MYDGLNGIVGFLKKNPGYVEVLERIVQWEEENYKCGKCGSSRLSEVKELHFKCNDCSSEQIILGFQWFDVSESGVRLNSLVCNKILRVSFKSRSGTHYRLIDREAVKEALKIIKEPTQTQEERIEIPPDLFLPIVGYDDVKEIIRRGLMQDKPVHFLLVGPVATAKSLFLEELNRIPGSSYHLGSSATKAGLTQFLLENRPRILLIDEFDKMSREDMAALLSLMESGKVVETKFGRRSEEYMKVWVVAACNSLKGIPPENISRFRPYIFHFREYTRDEFMQVAVKFLVEREGVEPNLAKYIAERVSAYTKDVRCARGLGRLCKNINNVDKYIETIIKYQGFS